MLVNGSPMWFSFAVETCPWKTYMYMYQHKILLQQVHFWTQEPSFCLISTKMKAANIYLLLKDHSESSKSSLKSPPGPRIAPEPPNKCFCHLASFLEQQLQEDRRNLARNNTKFQDKWSVLATTETLQRVTFHEQTP